MQGARRGKETIALALIDLERFKAINDTLGQQVGDRVLQELARRLQEAGTYHVIAISGGNIAILVGLALVGFRVTGMLGPAAMLTAAASLTAYAYIVGGGRSVERATLTAVAAANYVARRLGEHFPVLYSGEDGYVAHECILDLRRITKTTGVTVDDVAKRLADYGLHAPTMSFPVAGTLMVEPTESEDLPEIDRFVDAMIGIRAEIDRVGAGEWPVDDNPLRSAPHTAACLVDKWDHPYPRELAAYPTGVTPGVHDRKVWPPVRRVDGAYGDRNLVCSCPPVQDYAGDVAP